LNTSPFKCSYPLLTSITIKPTFPRRTTKNCRYIFLNQRYKTAVSATWIQGRTSQRSRKHIWVSLVIHYFSLRDICVYEPSGWFLFATSGFLRWNWSWPPYTEGKQRLKKEANHSRLAGSRFNKQGNLHTRLVLGSYKMRSLPESEKFTEALLSWLHISPDGLSNTVLSEHCILETALAMGIVDGRCFPRTGEKVRRLWWPDPAHRSTGGQVLLLTSNDWMAKQEERTKRLGIRANFQQPLFDGKTKIEVQSCPNIRVLVTISGILLESLIGWKPRCKSRLKIVQLSPGLKLSFKPIHARFN